MYKSHFFYLVTAILILSFSNSLISQELQKKSNGEKYEVIMRADDIGFSNAANIAIIKGYREGVITSTEVLVPGPWFLAAAKLLRENPGLDVGVHLALTSEWDNYKWGAVTSVQSLTTKDGYFPVNNEELHSMNIKLDEVENELRAQIELAKKYIPQVSHLSAHMGTAVSTPALKQIVVKLSQEYNLPYEDSGIDYGIGLWNEPIEQKENFLKNSLNDLKPGVTVIVFHLALNNEESRAIEGSDYDANQRMALHREAETKAVTNSEIKQIIIDRKIRLRSYSGEYRDIKNLK